ncbi:hypothetical protein SK128_027702, partial [Halocaridina rubra]
VMVASLSLTLILVSTISQAASVNGPESSTTSHESLTPMENLQRLKNSIVTVLENLQNSGGERFYNESDTISNNLTKFLKYFTEASAKDDKNSILKSFAITHTLNTLVKSLTSKSGNGDTGTQLLHSFLQQVPEGEDLPNTISDTLGLHRNFGKALFRIISAMKDVTNKSKKSGNMKDKSLSKKQKYSSDKLNSLDNEIDSNDIDIDSAENEEEYLDANSVFITAVKNIFAEEFGPLDFISFSTDGKEGKPSSLNETSSTVTRDGIWMMIKSTWQRILAYAESENALKNFMENTPVKIVDRIVSLGDDVNLASFLAKKLDPEFADFLSEKLNPYLGPLKDFDSFYNFTREYGLNGIVDHFSAERVGNTLSTMSRLISAYMQDAVSEDIISEYIDFISFNNSDLRSLYKAFVVNKMENNPDAESDGTSRFKRQALHDIVDSVNNPVKYNVYSAYETDVKETDEEEVNTGRDFARASGYGGSGGGGGGGCYGCGGMMQSMDPTVALGALALGTLLGLILARLLFGSRRNGKRDINDGSLSLWLSDMPDAVFPWNKGMERMKRNVNQTGQEENINVPASLRGDVWKSDPLVGEHFFDDVFEEDDIVNELNHVWGIYKNSSSPACVHSHVCHTLANSTAEDLTGKDSSMGLLM